MSRPASNSNSATVCHVFKIYLALVASVHLENAVNITHRVLYERWAHWASSMATISRKL